MPDLASLSADPALSLADVPTASLSKRNPTSFDASEGITRAYDVAAFKWQLRGGADCVLVFAREARVAGYSLNADYVLQRGQDTLEFIPRGAPGEYCLTFLPLAKGRKGQQVSSCFASDAPRLPGIAFAGQATYHTSRGWSVSPELALGAGTVLGLAAAAALGSRLPLGRRRPSG